MHLARGRSPRFELEAVRLPLIALIDVVLFLLFYFVISYSPTGEERELGTALATVGAPSTAGDAAARPQVLKVGWLDDRPAFRVGDEVITESAALTHLLRTLPREAGIVVMAASDAPVEATAAAVQAGKDAGFEKISYAIMPATGP